MKALPLREAARVAACGWTPDAGWQEKLEASVRPRWPTGAALPTCWRHERLELAALVGREPCPGDPSPRWHVSVSGRDALPPWNLLVRAAHDLRPGVVFCVGVPPRSWWMNIHPNVLHLWELRDAALVAEYRANAKGHAPS